MAAYKRTSRQNDQDLPPGTLNDQSPEQLQPEPEDRAAEMGFFDYLRSQPSGLLQNALIYFYRIEPKIKNIGPNAYIDRVNAEGVDEEWLKAKHGGGKYRAWLNTGDKTKDIQRIISIVGPAKIYPEHEMVDAAGNPLPKEPTAPTAAPVVTQSDIANIVTTAIQAVTQKGASADEALAQGMSVLRKAQEGSIEILTSSLKNQVSGNSNNGNDALLRELLQEIRAQRNNPGDRKLDKIVDAGLERLLNPPTPEKPKSFIEMLQELKALQDVEGLGAILGTKQEGGSWWEPLVGKLADALSETLKANGPAIIEAYREKIRVDAFVAAQRRAPGPQIVPATVQPQQGATQTAPAPNTPAASLPLPIPVPIPAAGPSAAPPEYPLPAPGATPPPAPHTPPAMAPQTPAQPPSSEEQQVFEIIRKQITELIATCYMENDSGEDAAITVKRVHKSLLPLLRPQFGNFEQVMAMAKVEPAFASIVNNDDFPEFAKEFWEEFMRD